MFATVQRSPSLLPPVALVALLVLAACGGDSPPIQQPADCVLRQSIQLVVQAADRVNMDDRGRSLPTVVRLYQLKELTRMENAEFEEVWHRAEDTLGPDLMQMDEVVVYPQQRLERAFERKEEAQYIVGVAWFRRPQGVSWRSEFELPPPPAESRCRAQQEDPMANPGPDADPHFFFFLEDYRIQAGEDPSYEPPRRRRRASEGGGIDLDDVPTDTPSGPEAPAGPEAPSGPSAPSAPSGPSAPTVP